MAFSKQLAHYFLAISKIRVAAATSIYSSPLIQRRHLFQAAVPPDRRILPNNEKLIERIRVQNSSERIRLEGILQPRSMKKEIERGMTVKEVRAAMRAAMRASQMEAARSRLRALPRSCVSYTEFLQICCEVAGDDQGQGIASSLDESGAVIVLGNAVFLRPDQVAKAIESLIPLHSSPHSDRRRDELREMEEKKAAIDKKAEAQVRAELWCGLGFLVMQTAGMMRLTFWDLSWDVMEPICFYITSVYFMVGYTFFMRTSHEPSFEGLFESRFATKQKRLMKAHNFDTDRFRELKLASRAAHPTALAGLSSSSPCCHCSRREASLEVAH